MDERDRPQARARQDPAARPPAAPPPPAASARAWRPEHLAFAGELTPIEVLEDVVYPVGTALADLRAARALTRMASALWLGTEALAALETEPARAGFRAQLADAGIALTSLDAVAYGESHARPQKQGLFLPDWSDQRRLRYTLACAQVLAQGLAPEVPEGVIVTVPLGWRATWSGEKENRSVGHLLEAARALDALAARTGRPIRLCLEPEPGATLERTDQIAAFYNGWLLPAAQALGLARETVRRHIGICFDTCHQAVMFEEPGAVLERLLDDDVPVGKLQLGCALEAPDAASKAELATHAGPDGLRQVRLRRNGHLHGAPDLDQAFARADMPRDATWRVRFHVPVRARELDRGLRATQAELLGVLDLLARRPSLRPQLEVEIDTWNVLADAEPAGTGSERGTAVAAELSWVEAQLQRRGLMT